MSSDIENNYRKLTDNIVHQFAAIVGPKYMVSRIEDLEVFARDETEDLRYYPELVLKPANANEISQILILANQLKIPVTPRGAGTGLSGGALPIYGGIVLSTERLNRIIEIDERNFQATVEPGVINQVFQEAVKQKGLFYPPDPASMGSCFLGGNLAECSGGPKAVKYGVTKDYVLSTEVVLPTGEIITTGAKVLKNVTGYNLTQLIIGSEGTLGVITKIVFRLLCHPKHSLLMLVPFLSSVKACEAVEAIFRAGITPSGLEFMERDAIEWTMQFIDSTSIPLKDGVEAHLLIEVDGNNPEVLYQECDEISNIVSKFDTDEILFAETEIEKERLWKIRRSIGEAVKANSVYKEEDTVVPRAELPKLLSGVKTIGAEYGFKSVCYGHAGDGNLHINIIKGNMPDKVWDNDLSKGIASIFELCKDLGGTISGEHGIGLVQKKYLPIVMDEVQINLQKDIKRLFDPNNILNPGKIFA